MLEGSTPLTDINGFNLRAIVNTDGVSLVSGNMHTGGVVTLASAAIVAVQCTANAEITLAGVDLATLYLVPIGSVS
jgi:hypothetical protein